MPLSALHNCAPERSRFKEEVIHGLSQQQKTLPCKFFYDEMGSRLFDQICELPEYYPTRTETAIMQQFGPEMARAVGPHVRLIEYGSGSSIKTRLLLDHLACPSSYMPMDISKEHLQRSAAALSAAYPALDVLPICADYTQPFQIPSSVGRAARTVIYFPGSTIGNFHPEHACRFLAGMADVGGPNSGLLIGVDLKKSPAVLEPAYNDKQGVTRAFNLNILHRINQDLDGGFHIADWDHLAFYNSAAGRIEMHLVSLCDQNVEVDEESVHFDEDETIWTECSYKYTPDEFAALGAQAGWDIQNVWTDSDRLFSVQYFTRSPLAE